PLCFQTLQSRVDSADRYPPTQPIGQVMPDWHSVGIQPKSENGEQNRLLELTQCSASHSEPHPKRPFVLRQDRKATQRLQGWPSFWPVCARNRDAARAPPTFGRTSRNFRRRRGETNSARNARWVRRAEPIRGAPIVPMPDRDR